jgi:hypothetical protein
MQRYKHGGITFRTPYVDITQQYSFNIIKYYGKISNLNEVIRRSSITYEVKYFADYFFYPSEFMSVQKMLRNLWLSDIKI